jgi:hypothetical protein
MAVGIFLCAACDRSQNMTSFDMVYFEEAISDLAFANQDLDQFMSPVKIYIETVL